LIVPARLLGRANRPILPAEAHAIADDTRLRDILSVPATPSEMTSGEVESWGAASRDRALQTLADEDWRGTYELTKSWVSRGGGAWLPDAWLMYAASALLRRQPKIAVHSLDLALGTWLSGSVDRPAISWCRGLFVWFRLNDPKTALLDLEPAFDLAPQWLGSDLPGQIARCRVEAQRSRKRTASVKSQPEFLGSSKVVVNDCFPRQRQTI